MRTLASRRLQFLQTSILIRALIAAVMVALLVPVGSAAAASLTITGTPEDIAVTGEYYTFEPDTSGRNSRWLRFSITGKPSWARFSQRSGRLYGVPGVSHIGIYNNIVITASSGRRGTRLAPFSITVQSPGSSIPPTQSPPSPPAPTPTPTPTYGNATISWTPPLTNVDGSALTTLAGYRIYYGTQRGGPYPSTVAINTSGLSTYVVEDLSSGTWFFVMTARNSAGTESSHSTEVSKTLD